MREEISEKQEHISIMEKIEIAGKCLFVAFAAAAAWQDFKWKQIEAWVFIVFGAAAGAFVIFALIACMEEGWKCYLAGCFPGIFLLLCSKMTGGEIGEGDGLFFLVSGGFLGIEENLMLFIGGTMLCGLFGLGIFIYKKIRYGIYSGKERLPFLPFAAAWGAWMLAFEGIWGG